MNDQCPMTKAQGMARPPSLLQRAAVVVLCAVMLQPWGAYRLMAADITPGYTFTSGEANVTHTKLNNSAAGTINTTFYSGKSSAGSDPTPANYTFLGLDSVSGTFKRQTLDAWVFDHSALIADRTVKTVLLVGDTLLMNQGGAYYQVSGSNAFFGGTSYTTASNDTRLGGVLSGGAIGSLTLSNLLAGLTSHSLPTNGDVFMVLTENGKAVKALSLEAMVRNQTAATNATNWQSLVWDGTRLRTTYETNRIAGLQLAAPTTNDQFAFLQSGILKKGTLQGVRTLLVDAWNNNYALLQHQTAPTTNGGGLTVGDWRGRQLNTEVDDVAGMADLFTMIPRAGSTTSGSPIVTGLSGTSDLVTNQHVYAVTGLPNNPKIISIDSSSQITLSTNANATGVRTLTFGGFLVNAGTYRFKAKVPGHQVTLHQARLFNVTDGIVLGLGSVERSSSADNSSSSSWISGRFTNATSKILELQHQVSANNTTDGGGTTAGFGVEVYSELELWREAQ